MKNVWANEGDLVFIIMDDEEIIPAKIIGIDYKVPIKSSILYFKPIEDERITLPLNKRQCNLAQVGFAGGFVFTRKANAEDYLSLQKEEEGFSMTNVLNRKTRRNQAKYIQNNGIPDIDQIKQEAATQAVVGTHKTIIAALLLAMNSELGIGAKRGEQVIAKMNSLIETSSSDELKKEVSKKLKITLN